MGPFQRHLDTRAHEVEVVLPPLKALADHLVALPTAAPPVSGNLRRGSLLSPHHGAAPVTRVSQVEALVVRGEMLVEALRRRPAEARPGGRELTSWRRQASLMVAYFRVLDPEWLAGYESALTSRDRRLIGAMW
jgi:hypothetical protein